MHIACKHGNIDAVKYLLIRGALLEDIDEVSLILRILVLLTVSLQHGLTPLHFACLYGQFSVVQVLVEKGAKYDAVTEVNIYVEKSFCVFMVCI